MNKKILFFRELKKNAWVNWLPSYYLCMGWNRLKTFSAIYSIDDYHLKKYPHDFIRWAVPVIFSFSHLYLYRYRYYIIYLRTLSTTTVFLNRVSLVCRENYSCRQGANTTHRHVTYVLYYYYTLCGSSDVGIYPAVMSFLFPIRILHTSFLNIRVGMRTRQYKRIQNEFF